MGIPITQDEVIEDEEIDRCAWFTLEELSDIEAFPDIKISFSYILNNILK